MSSVLSLLRRRGVNQPILNNAASLLRLNYSAGLDLKDSKMAPGELDVVLHALGAQFSRSYPNEIRDDQWVVVNYYINLVLYGDLASDPNKSLFKMTDLGIPVNKYQREDTYKAQCYLGLIDPSVGYPENILGKFAPHTSLLTSKHLFDTYNNVIYRVRYIIWEVVEDLHDCYSTIRFKPGLHFSNTEIVFALERVSDLYKNRYHYLLVDEYSLVDLYQTVETMIEII